MRQIGGVYTTSRQTTSATAKVGSVPSAKVSNTNGRRIVVQIGGVYNILLSANRRAYFRKSIAIEIGGVSRYFQKYRGERSIRLA